MGLVYMVTLTGVPEPFTLNLSFWQLANMVCFLSASGSSSPRKCDVAALHRGNGDHADHSDANQVSNPVIAVITTSIIPDPVSYKNEIATMSMEEIINPTKALMEEENVRPPSIRMPSNRIMRFLSLPFA